MPKQEYLECGKIINTHGVAGAMKVESWCDSPSVLSGKKTVYRKTDGQFVAYKVKKASVFKHLVIMELDGVSDIDAAAALKGEVLYADRGSFKLAKGAFFIADIIGLEVIDAESGHVYGTLCDVSNLGASDIYTVKTENGDRMIPAVPEFVKQVDVEHGIYITPIEGMFD